MFENQEKALEQADITRRLEAGEELNFGEIAVAFSIRPSECWKFEGYGGRGRSPDPCLPHSEIPASAWPHLRWEMRGLQFILITPTGTLIYDARVRLSPANTVAVQPVFEREYADHAPAASPEPNAVFDAIVTDDMPDGVSWSLDKYRAALAASGLTVMKDTLRVPGITIVTGGKVERGASSIHLRNALVVRRFCLEEAQGRYAGLARTAVARLLILWLTDHHPDLITRAQRTESGFPSEVAKVLGDHGLQKTGRAAGAATLVE